MKMGDWWNLKALFLHLFLYFGFKKNILKIKKILIIIIFLWIEMRLFFSFD